jgi:hypothetical protein
MLLMTLLAYDRFQAIVTPLKYSSPNKSCWVAIHIASSYAVSYAMWISPIILMVWTGPYDLDCYFEKSSPLIVAFIAANIISLFAMTFLYVGCIDGLRRQFRKLHPVVTRVTTSEKSVFEDHSSFFHETFDFFKRRFQGRGLVVCLMSLPHRVRVFFVLFICNIVVRVANLVIFCCHVSISITFTVPVLDWYTVIIVLLLRLVRHTRSDDISG